MLLLSAGRKGQAIELYLKGIEELNKGIALDVSGQGDSSNESTFYFIYIHCSSINQSINQLVYSFIKHCSVQLWQIHEQDEQGSRGVLMAAKTSYLIICIW